MSQVDHFVVVAYLAAMLVLGVGLSRRQRSDDEYFLAGRRMPWFAVGMSVIASLLSSLTYLSEPGEVWNSGMTHVLGKLIAIPIEMAIVWLFCIPFMMRFRFTSAYEYLEHRFAPSARMLGVALFLAMVVLWMGFVVLASARALSKVTDIDLFIVITTVGAVATVYTMLGGMRAVIWTDVVQVVLLIGGGAFAIGYVVVTTGTWLPDWYATAAEHLRSTPGTHELPIFSLDPTVRATIVMVAVNMCIWHICTHTANQMTVQRYYSTTDMRAARRSFLTGSLFGVGLNSLLVVVGLAVLFFYLGQDVPLDNNLDPNVKQDRDLIFPTFAVNRLPPGFGGAILAALLAAAMSSIDSGVNSMATVISVELRERRGAAGGSSTSASSGGTGGLSTSASGASGGTGGSSPSASGATAGFSTDIEAAPASGTGGQAASGTHLKGTHLKGTHLNGTHLNGTHSPAAATHHPPPEQPNSHVGTARLITLVVGTFITAAAYLLSFLPSNWGIVDSMPRTFNAITAPLGGLFLVGMFLPMAGPRAAVFGTLCGMAVSVSMGYWVQIGTLLHDAGLVASVPPELSFTWIMPSSLLATLTAALLLSPLDRKGRKNLAGLTWFTRHEASPLTSGQ